MCWNVTAVKQQVQAEYPGTYFMYAAMYSSPSLIYPFLTVPSSLEPSVIIPVPKTPSANSLAGCSPVPVPVRNWYLNTSRTFPHSFNPYQFTYRSSRSTEAAISITLRWAMWTTRIATSSYPHAQHWLPTRLCAEPPPPLTIHPPLIYHCGGTYLRRNLTWITGKAALIPAHYSMDIVWSESFKFLCCSCPLQTHLVLKHHSHF